MTPEALPVFLQIAEGLEQQIISGSLPEGARAPSTSELVAFHKVNPATAAKGVKVLADLGLLEKRRGLGMFVADGARQTLLAQRRGAFLAEFVRPLLAEASSLGMNADQVLELITKEIAAKPQDFAVEASAPIEAVEDR